MRRHVANAAISFFAATAIFLLSGNPCSAQVATLENEQELLAFIRSDESPADKAMACKRLAIYGTSESVPDLARLLTDEKFASWARIALEAIPGPAADEALQAATESLDGNLLIGVINSIGVRRYAGAVESLAKYLEDRDPNVISAAAVALGRIGNADAAKVLRPGLSSSDAKARSAIAEGCVLCAERLWQSGESETAIEMYDEIRKADVSQPRILEATRGAILARKDDGIPLLLEQLQSSNKAMFQLALTTAREFPGSGVDTALADELVKATPERAALVVHAMADRTATVKLDAILKAASSGPDEVRIAAIEAIGRVGDATCVTPLLDIALESNANLSEATKAALSAIPDQSIGKDIVARLPKAEGKMYALLIEVIGQRRVPAIDELTKALDNDDQAVRVAALNALGNTVSADQLSLLVAQVVKPKSVDDVDAAKKSLKMAAVRMPDREACATLIANSLDSAPVSTQSAILEILAEVGGTKSLQTVGAAAKGKDPVLQDVGSRLLGDWMTIDAAPVLLDLAKTGPGEKYQVRAMRGYIRIARQFTMEDSERVVMCRNAFEASRTAEKKLILEVMKRYASVDMLKLAISASASQDVKSEARQAALDIAAKLGNTPEIKALLSSGGIG